MSSLFSITNNCIQCIVIQIYSFSLIFKILTLTTFPEGLSKSTISHSSFTTNIFPRGESSEINPLLGGHQKIFPVKNHHLIKAIVSRSNAKLISMSEATPDTPAGRLTEYIAY